MTAMHQAVSGAHMAECTDHALHGRALPCRAISAAFHIPLQRLSGQRANCIQQQRRQLQHRTSRGGLACSASGDPAGGDRAALLPANTASTGFGSLERVLADNAADKSGGRKDWQEVEGCWVLGPPPGTGPPQAVAMFCGGAFAGAAPQLTYRLLIECLTNRNLLVVAVPFSTGFNHIQIADEAQYKFERCMQALTRQPGTADAVSLPVYGIGHSLGSLVHLLISTRYASQRNGNVLISFNNKPLDDVPLITPFLSPALRVVGPLLSQLATSPARTALFSALEGLRSSSPAVVRQLVPVLDQLEPIFAAVANGTQQFTPPPEETRAQLRSSYGVLRNLILQFQNDTIDESPALAEALRANSLVAPRLTYRTLPGDHTRPLLQTVGDLPPELRNAATAAAVQGEDFVKRFTTAADQAGFSQASRSINDLAKGMLNIGSALNGSLSSTNAAVVAEMQSLADEIADWMAEMVLVEPPAALPPAGRSSF